MKKKILWGIILILLLGIGIMSFGILIPVYFVKRDISLSAPLVMEQQMNGNWILSWNASEDADGYRIELVTIIDGQENEVLYQEFTSGETSVLLPPLPDNMDVSVQVTPVVKFRTLLGEDYRYSQITLKATARFADMTIAIQDFAVNGDDKTLKLEIQGQENPEWQFQLFDSADNILAEQILTEPSLVVQFGEKPYIALPKEGEEYYLHARTFQEEPNLLIFGMPSNDFRITEESLQFRKLHPKVEVISKNTVQITWEETRGSHYEVQILDPEIESWNTICTVSQEEPRVYLDWLEPGQTKQYRVAAFDGQGEYLIVSDQMAATGRERNQYATVWPIRDLAAYSSPSMERVVETARQGTAFCILEEVNGLFAVRIQDKICYIDSDYCMINLPEYIGGLCNYNITNSVYSIYTIHEFAIENVTGVVTRGYEDICQEDGSYLVPLLYPTAKKLLNAAKSAWEQGYRLKVYDSFRPHIATLEIFDLTSLIMDDAVPNTTYMGVSKENMELPDPKIGWDYLSLGWLMTGSNYLQNSFLAKGGSTHNLGIALDLTLEKLDTGEEIQMQTSIHDLSQYSVLSENNDSAELLSTIMHSAGFSGLISEWWHFQDDYAKGCLDLPYMEDGVNAECWVKDNNGWRYRGAKGEFYCGQSVTISETDYVFDTEGYVIDSRKEMGREICLSQDPKYPE